MKQKITVYLNRITTQYQDDFAKAQAYHLKHGVNIEFDFKPISVNGYVSVPLNGKYILQGADKLVQIDPAANSTIFFFNQDEWKSPVGSQFPYLPTTPTGSCQLINGRPFMNIGTNPIDHADGQTWIMIAHEILHSLVEQANLKGFGIIDVLDSYYHNDDPDYPNGNFAQDWALLKPFLTASQPLVVTITRQSDDGVQTLGDLNYGNFNCKTLERPWLNNKPDVSCIPKGIYTCKYTFSLGNLGWTYALQNVPNRSGIRIHVANFYLDLEGCIGLGSGYQFLNGDKEADLINSRLTINAFVSLLNKKDFTLVIQ